MLIFKLKLGLPGFRRYRHMPYKTIAFGFGFFEITLLNIPYENAISEMAGVGVNEVDSRAPDAYDKLMDVRLSELKRFEAERVSHKFEINSLKDQILMDRKLLETYIEENVVDVPDKKPSTRKKSIKK